MPFLSASAGGGWDYVQATEPANPEKGDSWYDTDGGADGQGEAKVYDGSTWDVTGYISHDQLNNVAPADHHDPVTVSAPLTRSAQALALAIGNALTVDGNNDLAVDESAISHDNIGGVSAADHHNPVTVSDPLTEDGTQGLALALAANLRVNGGTLDLARNIEVGDDYRGLHLRGTNATEESDTADKWGVRKYQDDFRIRHYDDSAASWVKKLHITPSGEVGIADGPLHLGMGNIKEINKIEASGTGIETLWHATDNHIRWQRYDDQRQLFRLDFDAMTAEAVDADLYEQGNRVATRPYVDGEVSTHEGRTDNPHNVTDDQTGAASALSSHAGDADAHLGTPTDESGTLDPGSTGIYSTTVSLTNSYVSGSATAGVFDSGNEWSPSRGNTYVENYTFDGNGHIDGFVLHYETDTSSSDYVKWTFTGNTA
ncbi:hypothetical protein [Haloarcula marina]|uniref:hypothetical protein n=1 Tax=Haloarcula marina TaxID=2961574 RepID=UPI0020B7DB1B|nr:hypothetical protein [Halomicroarcula marina]